MRESNSITCSSSFSVPASSTWCFEQPRALDQQQELLRNRLAGDRRELVDAGAPYC